MNTNHAGTHKATNNIHVFTLVHVYLVLQIFQEEIIVDFEHLENHEDVFTGCDVGFNCLGTTRSKGGKVI